MQKSPFEIFLQDAEKAFVEKQLITAADRAEKALHLAKKSGKPRFLSLAWNVLGRIELAKNRLAGEREALPVAADYFRQALDIQPDTLENLLGKAETLAEMHRYEEASKLILEVLSRCNSTDDTYGRVVCLTMLSKLSMFQNEFPAALMYAQEAQNIVDNQKYVSDGLKAEVLHQLLQIQMKRQAYHVFPEFCQPLLELSRNIGDVEKEVAALNALAVLNGARTDYKTAMQYFLEALEKSEACHMRVNTAHCLINIGTIYALLFNYDDALDRYQRIINEYVDVLSTSNQVVVHNNMGNIFYYKRRFHDALRCYHDAINLANSAHYDEMLCLSKAQLCKIYLALESFDQAAEIAAELEASCFGSSNWLSGKQIHCINQAQLALHRKNYRDALQLSMHSLRYARTGGDEAGEIQAYELLSQIYDEMGDHKMALKCHKKYSVQKEQYQQNQRHLQITDLEIKYDIREEQRKIEQLKRENEYQAHIIDQSSHIEKQNAQLMQINEELRQFAYAASHDLKEPLRMIGSFTQLIHRRFNQYVDEESATYFEFVKEGAVRMNSLLDALLRYSTIGQVAHTFNLVNVEQIVNMCRANLHVLIEETSTSIHVNNLPILNSVESLQMQLFQNLISNAIKFRKPGNPCLIQIQGQQVGHEWIIEVHDNGIGIDPEHHDRIFVIFQRLHTRTKYEGAGIGLAICHKIVQQLGGRIWVESTLGQGATFFIALPIAAPSYPIA